MSYAPPLLVAFASGDGDPGRKHIVSNINACQVVADNVRSTLGPRGMDKLIVNSNGKTTISNDGATIMKEIDVVHPAAKALVDIAKSQDAEVGDGTTSVVLLASEILKNLKPFIDEGVHPMAIIRSIRQALQLSLARIREVAVKIDKNDVAGLKSTLEKCAATTLSSKLLAHNKEFFAKMAVEAVLTLDDSLPLNMIGIKKVQGGSLEDSMLVKGVAFKKTFSYAGFEMQPKKLTNAKVALLNIELELKSERDNAEVRLNTVEEYQNVVDAEWQILYEKLKACQDAGATIVLSKLPIGDVATQWFADRDIFCAGRVVEEDLKRVQQACGGSILTTVQSMESSNLGTCGLMEEQQIGNERFNLFTDCPLRKTCTLILRGGAEQFIAEMERSLHDAIMIVRRALKNDQVVAGGGAIELELSKYLRDYSKTIEGKQQLFVAAYARALEIIPRQLAENCGMDITLMLNQMRAKHQLSKENLWIGINIQTEEGFSNNMEKFVWEPALVKINALTAASEAACLIISVDETIKDSQAGQDNETNAAKAMAGQERMRGMGRP